MITSTGPRISSCARRAVAVRRQKLLVQYSNRSNPLLYRQQFGFAFTDFDI